MTNSALAGGIFLISTCAIGQNHFIESPNPIQEHDQVIVEGQKENITSLAIGDNANASGNYTIAIGPGASATQDNTMVLGGETLDDRVSVGIGTSDPNSLSSLDLGDTDKGILVNRLTDDQAEIFELALSTSDQGMMIYNTSQETLQTWDGVKWVNVSSKNLSLNNNILALDNGSSVDLSSYQQDLTSATLNGKNLTIEIENGEDVTVDLTPIFSEYEARLAAIENKLMAINTEEVQINDEGQIESKVSNAKLFQNTPNPFNGRAQVEYFIPAGANSAHLVLQNTAGKILLNDQLFIISGDGKRTVVADNFKPGVYYLSLYVDRKKMDTITMVIK